MCQRLVESSVNVLEMIMNGKVCHSDLAINLLILDAFELCIIIIFLLIYCHSLGVQNTTSCDKVCQ
jgi:hypothetical protein